MCIRKKGDVTEKFRNLEYFLQNYFQSFLQSRKAEERTLGMK